MIPGAPAADAPVDGPAGPWLLGHLQGGFVLLAFGASIPEVAIEKLASAQVPCAALHVLPFGKVRPGVIIDHDGLVASRYDAREGTVVLLRPDQHVCARWRRFDLARVRGAIARATAND